MKSILMLVSICMLLMINAHSQGSDIITLKKKNGITKKTFFAGGQIQFIDISGSEVNGVIKKIANDSIYINLFDTRRQYTIWGTSFLDTIAVFTSRYHYKEIREIIKPPKGFGFVKNGLIFIISGVGYAFLHTFNAIYLKEKIDGKTMALSGAAVLTGILLKKTHHNSIRLGKQYYLQYIPLK
jgi:hypothetical protein